MINHRAGPALRSCLSALLNVTVSGSSQAGKIFPFLAIQLLKVCSVEHRKKVLDGINIGFPFFVCFLLWSHSRPGLWKLIVGWEFLEDGSF